MTCRDWPGGAPVAWSVRVFLVTFALSLFSTRTADPDFWGHLAIGRLIWESHAVPLQDAFSYLPTRDWINYEWMANVVYYPLYQWLGGGGIVVFKTLIGMATLATIYRVSRRRTGSDFAVVLVLIPAVATIYLGFAPRAQVFTYFFFAVWIAVLEQSRTGTARRLVILPLTMILWANLHAGFLSGLGLLALYGLGQLLERKSAAPHGLALLACVGATLVNPYGWSYWTLLLEGITIRRPYITEWEPVPFDLASFPFFKICFLLALVSVAICRRSGERWEWSPVLALAVTAALAWKVQRHVPLFAIACGAYVPAYLEALRARAQADSPQHPLPASLFRVLCLLIVIGSGLSLHQAACPEGTCSLRLDESRYGFPRETISYLKAHRLRGNLAVEFRWGLYAVWHLHPALRCSVDGRYETVFDPRVIAQDLDFFYGRRTETFLRSYPTDYVLTDSPPLCRVLDKERRARLIHSSGGARLYRIAR